MGVLRTSASIAMLAMAGCTSHVALRAPPPSAPAAARLAAYRDLRSTTTQQTAWYRVTGWGMRRYEETTTDYMILGDGRRVFAPEDILPVVSESSVAAEAARDSASARSTTTALRVGAVVIGAVGLAVLLVPALTQDPGEELDLTAMYVGAGIIAASGVTWLLSLPFGAQAHEDAARAFLTYDLGLLERLDLCVPRDRLVPCDTGLSPAEPELPTRDEAPGGLSVPSPSPTRL